MILVVSGVRSGRACLSETAGPRTQLSLLGRELLPEAKALGLMGRRLPMILRSRRDAPYLRGRQAAILC